MLNERKLTKSELAKREDIIMKMKKNKRALTQKYGKDAEAVMYGRATKLAKKQAEAMDQDKIKELVKDALQNPKKADLNKDGKLSDYEKKRGAAIEKAMEKVDEMDLNDPVAMRLRADKAKRAANAGDDGNDKFFRNAAKLRALDKKRAEIMRDMEQEAEMEGGPIADKYGDMLNVIDAEIAKEKAMFGLEEEFDFDVKGGTEPDKDADVAGILGAEDVLGLEEGASTEEKRIAMRAIKSIAKYRGVSNDEARNDLIRAAREIGELKEGTELYNRDGFYFKRFYGGKEDGASLQITTDKGDFITIPGRKLGLFMSGLEKAVSEFDDMTRQLPVSEDLDLGHEDNEPHMLKADLYRIGKYAMELYQMVDKFEESSEEVDFPHWWQSKVIKAKDALVGAKHYLDFEVKEPQIDAMVDVASEEEVIDEPLNEGVWSLGSASDIKGAIHTLEMWLDLDAREISAQFDDKDNERFFYKVLGDDLFHDALDRAEKASAMDDTDRAHKATLDAKDRAEELLVFVQKREGIKEGLPKGYWDKKMDAKDEVNEDYEALVKKIKKQGKSEKAAKAIAGAVASYKAKGGGKGPTAKQKARG